MPSPKDAVDFDYRHKTAIRAGNPRRHREPELAVLRAAHGPAAWLLTGTESAFYRSAGLLSAHFVIKLAVRLLR